jgi:hypothetical protein
MALEEMAGWGALALALLLGVLLFIQGRRLGRMERRLRSFMAGAGPGAGGMSLGELISSQGARLDMTREEVEKLRGALTNLDTSVAHSIQHVGVVRFNPFADTGGDQSFAVALIDRRGDGVVISSLHGRTATRFYAKPVKGGTSALSLSDEEVQALKQAMDGTAATAAPGKSRA